MSNHWIWDFEVLKYVKANVANYHLNKTSDSQFFESMDFITTVDNKTLQIKFFCFGRQLKSLSL